MHYPFICLIDDQPSYRYSFERELRSMPFKAEYCTFGDGELALMYLESNLSDATKIPDIFFVDINMPVMDGWAFVNGFSKIKSSIKKETQLYFLSSTTNEMDISRAQSTPGITGIISKPKSAQQLKSVVQTVIENFIKAR